MLVRGRNFTHTVGGGPRELWGEDHHVTSIHTFNLVQYTFIGVHSSFS